MKFPRHSADANSWFSLFKTWNLPEIFSNYSLEAQKYQITHLTSHRSSLFRSNLNFLMPSASRSSIIFLFWQLQSKSCHSRIVQWVFLMLNDAHVGHFDSNWIENWESRRKEEIEQWKCDSLVSSIVSYSIKVMMRLGKQFFSLKIENWI